MREQNVATTRRVLSAFRDTAQLPRDAFAPNVVLDVSTWWGWTGEQQCTGFDALRKFFFQEIKGLREGSFRIEGLHVAGADYVLVTVHARGNGEPWRESRYALVLAFGQGLIDRVDGWSSPEEARKSLRLAE